MVRSSAQDWQMFTTKTGDGPACYLGQLFPGYCGINMDLKVQKGHYGTEKKPECWL